MTVVLASLLRCCWAWTADEQSNVSLYHVPTLFPRVAGHGDVSRCPLVLVPVSPLRHRGHAGLAPVAGVRPPEDAPVVDDGVGAPVPLVVHVEEQSLAVDIDPGSVVVLVLGLVLTQVLRPQPGDKPTGLQCDRARTTFWICFILRREQELD